VFESNVNSERAARPDPGPRAQAARNGAGSTLADRLLKGASIVSLCFLTFVAGAFMTEANVFPASLVGRAYYGAVAAYENMTMYRDVYKSRLWYPGRTGEAGVTVHDPARTEPGLTLYTSGHGSEALLIDLEGRELHRWSRPYSTLERDGRARPAPKSDRHVWFHSARAMPNGDLIAVYESVGQTPYGYGMVKLDRDSNVIWSYLRNVHHVFDVGPDGTIYALSQDIVDHPLEGFHAVGYPRLEDYLVVLSPEGEEITRISLVDALAVSGFRFLLQNVTWYGSEDPTHANAVQVVTPEMDAAFPYGEAGDVVVSMRELSTVAVVDVEERRVQWALRGSWIQQHDVQLLPDGHFLMFDNWGDYEGPTGISRIVEVDPVSSEITWVYRGTEQEPLASEVRSNVQRLPNGNTLISESDGGRLLEITPDGTIVWEFHNPRRGGPEGGLVAVVNGGERIPWSHFDPDFAERLRRAGADTGAAGGETRTGER